MTGLRPLKCIDNNSQWFGDSMISHGMFHFRGNCLDEIDYLDWWPEWYTIFVYEEGKYRLYSTTADLDRYE